MTNDSKERKQTPITTGVIDYFPDALAAVARVSFKGNQKHNPGEPLHWAKDKSTDHADCIGRHLAERGQINEESGESHTAHIAWRALAMLQIEIEKSRGPSHENTPAGYAPCTRPMGHTGPCALPLADPRKPLAYISGPMRGYADFNFHAFDRAKAILQAKGYEVISPADMDREQDNGTVQSATVYATRDCAALIGIAQADRPGSLVVTLHGYERSVGATAEVAIAKWLCIPIRHIEEFA